MDFFIGFFAVLIGLATGFNEASKDYCDGEIVDIYYPKEQEGVAYDTECPYTKTLLNCEFCGVEYIRRDKYDIIKKSFELRYQMKYPYPKRYDTDKVYPARVKFGY